MRCSSRRLGARPSRCEAAAMTRSSVMLPRSGLLSHSAGVVRGAVGTTTESDFTIRVPGAGEPGEPAGGHRTIGAANHKADRPISAGFVLDTQRFAGSHDA